MYRKNPSVRLISLSGRGLDLLPRVVERGMFGLVRGCQRRGRPVSLRCQACGAIAGQPPHFSGLVFEVQGFGMRDEGRGLREQGSGLSFLNFLGLPSVAR